MKCDQALALLRQSKSMLVSRYGVRRLALFGSTARDAARYFGVQFHLEDTLGCSVDLVSEKALRPELYPTSKKKRFMFELTREWRFYLTGMISFAEKVQAYTHDLDQVRFEASGLNYDATLRNLELIGEAATHIPDDIRSAHPDIL